MLNHIQILNIVATLEKYPLEVVVVKQLIQAGINSEESLVKIVESRSDISRPMKVKLHNSYRDIQNGMYGFKAIPTLLR